MEPTTTRPRLPHRLRAGLALLPLLLGGCFPTFQTARIENGFHLDAGATLLADQRRNDREQPADLMVYAVPSVGIGGVLELGLPAGIYSEGEDIGESTVSPVLWPYLKVGLLPPAGRDHLALILQAAWLAPANFGIRYGRDMGTWDLQAGTAFIFSGGPAGDDPFVTRYQEKGQLLTTFSVGAVLHRRPSPAVELGVLRNHYREGAVFGDFGQSTEDRTLYDLFLMGRIRIF